MLFIVVYQVYELWFKEIITELDSIRSLFMADYINESYIGKATAQSSSTDSAENDRKENRHLGFLYTKETED